MILRFSKSQGFWLFTNHPTEHSGAVELAGGESVALSVNVSDMSKVTGDTQHVTGDI